MLYLRNDAKTAYESFIRNVEFVKNDKRVKNNTIMVYIYDISYTSRALYFHL